MKHFTVLLTTGIVIFLVLLGGVFSLFNGRESPRPPVVISIDRDIAPLKTSLARREATYQAQIDALDETLQAQESEYQTQAEVLNAQILAAQKQLAGLQAQKQALQSELIRLEAIKTERSTTYQNQIEQTRSQYAKSIAHLQAQLDEAKATLADVNSQLQNR